MDKEKLMWLIWDYSSACQNLGYHVGMAEDDPIYIATCKKAEDARIKLVNFIDSDFQDTASETEIKTESVKSPEIDFCWKCGTALGIGG